MADITRGKTIDELQQTVELNEDSAVPISVGGLTRKLNIKDFRKTMIADNTKENKDSLFYSAKMTDELINGSTSYVSTLIGRVVSLERRTDIMADDIKKLKSDLTSELSQRAYDDEILTNNLKMVNNKLTDITKIKVGNKAPNTLNNDEFPLGGVYLQYF